MVLEVAIATNDFAIFWRMLAAKRKRGSMVQFGLVGFESRPFGLADSTTAPLAKIASADQHEAAQPSLVIGSGSVVAAHYLIWIGRTFKAARRPFNWI